MRVDGELLWSLAPVSLHGLGEIIGSLPGTRRQLSLSCWLALHSDVLRFWIGNAHGVPLLKMSGTLRAPCRACDRGGPPPFGIFPVELKHPPVPGTLPHFHHPSPVSPPTPPSSSLPRRSRCRRHKMRKWKLPITAASNQVSIPVSAVTLCPPGSYLAPLLLRPLTHEDSNPLHPSTNLPTRAWQEMNPARWRGPQLRQGR